MADDAIEQPGVASTSAAPAAAATAAEPLTDVPANGDVDVDTFDDGDSALGDDDWQSDTTSLASAYVRGQIENGRKYQVVREDKYWGPSDEKQFDTMELAHLVNAILDSQCPNQLFHAPVGDKPQNILDIGTGEGTWAVEVADKFPSATVYGIDLYPPPAVWVPPNCIFQVDDITLPWSFPQKFDLVHMRMLYGSFTAEESDAVYNSAYSHLLPGGWIEQWEMDIRLMSDDGSVAEDSVLNDWGHNFLGCAERSGRPLNTQLTMRASIEKAGFVNVQEKVYKCPLGGWPKHKIYKDAGRVNKAQWLAGLEGWAMWLLTKHGAPTPWSSEEVHVYVSKMRMALNDPTVHAYNLGRRVWAQKPTKE